MSCETIETLLQESLLILNHVDKYEAYLEYLHSEWLYTVDDLKLAFSNETTYLNLKIPARLKLELVALLDQTESAKIDAQEDVEEKDSEAYPAADYTESHQETSKEWVSCYSTEYQCYYYYNTLTYESSWECPDPTLHYEYVEYVPSEDASNSAQDLVVSTAAENKAFSKPKASEAKNSIFKASPKHTEIPDTPPAAVRPPNSKLLPKNAEAKSAPVGKTIFDNSDSSDEENDDRGGAVSSASVSRRHAEEVASSKSREAKQSNNNSSSSPRSPSGLQSNGHTVIYNKGTLVGGEDPFSTTRAVANSGRKQKQQQQSWSVSSDPPLAVAVPVPSRGIFDIDDDDEQQYSIKSSMTTASAAAPPVDPRAQYASNGSLPSEFNSSFYNVTVGTSAKVVASDVQQQQQKKHQPSSAHPQRAATASSAREEQEQQLLRAPPAAEGPAALSGYQGYNSKLRSKPSPREGGSDGGNSRSSSTKSHTQASNQQTQAAGGGSSRPSSTRSSASSSHSNYNASSGRHTKPAVTADYSSSSEEEEGRVVQVRAARRGGEGGLSQLMIPQPQQSRQQQSQLPAVLPSAPPAEPIYASPVHSKHHNHNEYLERITPPAAPPHLESPLSAAIRTSPHRGAAGGGLNSYIVSDESEGVNYLDLAMAEGATLSDTEERAAPRGAVLSPPSTTSEEQQKTKKKKGGIKKHFNKLLNLFGGGGGGSSAGKKYKGSDPKVGQLIAMGFDEQEAAYALTMCDRDVSLAVKMLRHKDEEDEEEEEEEDEEEEGADHASEPYR